jgi:hypothetical protein
MEDNNISYSRSDVYRDISKKKFGKTIFPDKMAYQGVENKTATNSKLLVVLGFSVLIILLIAVTGVILNSYLYKKTYSSVYLKVKKRNAGENNAQALIRRSTPSELEQTQSESRVLQSDEEGIIIVKNNQPVQTLFPRPDISMRVYIDQPLYSEVMKKAAKVGAEKNIPVRLLGESDAVFQKIIKVYENYRPGSIFTVLLQPEDIVRYANYLCLLNGYSRVDIKESSKKDPFIIKRNKVIKLGKRKSIRTKNYISMLEIAVERLIFYYRKDFYKILRLKEKNLAFRKRMVDNIDKKFIMKSEILRVMNSSFILNQRVILEKMLKEIR